MRIAFDGQQVGELTPDQVSAAASVAAGANAPDVNSFLFQELYEVCNRWAAAVAGARAAKLNEITSSLDATRQARLVEYLQDPAKLAEITDPAAP